MKTMVPKIALEYIKNKKLKPAFSYKDVWNEEHISSFTVAKIMQLEALKNIKDAVEKAVENGETLEQFKKNIKKKNIKHEYELSDFRLRTIYETNLRSAYMKGRFDRAYSSDAHPYLMYKVGPSKNHRPEHLAWNGLILDKNDPFWLSHNPPNGWSCKCYTVAVSKQRKERYENEGITVNIDGKVEKIEAKLKAPKITYKTYVNKRNGTISKVPAGIEPSFNFNQGSYDRDLVLFNDFMKKAKKSFPKRFENIAETILRNEIKKEQFESFIDKAFSDDFIFRAKDITAVGFISSDVARLLKNKAIDIGENVTVGLEARLLNGIKAKRHKEKDEALKKSDAKYIIDCMLDGEVYLQKDDNNILYLYQVEENKYLQIAVKTLEKISSHKSSLKIPLVKNIQFISELQKKSKFDANKIKWEKIK